jgi:tRNA dimethylallyltransferase
MKTIILSGPTASGKTGLAIALAQLFPGKIEIINADSLLFYRGMDIGTAKPTLEERAGIPHHLIDICNPDEPLSAGDFVRLVLPLLDRIHSEKKRAIIVGGSGFYLQAMLYGLWEAPPADPDLRKEMEQKTPMELFEALHALDPEAALRISAGDRYRLVRALEIHKLTGKTPSQLQAQERSDPDPRFELWVVDRKSEALEKAIEERSRKMLERGWIQETETLLAKYSGSRPLKAVGYRQIQDYLEGRRPPGRQIKAGLPGLLSEIELATRQLVKKQRTWFNSETHKKNFLLPEDFAVIETEFKKLYAF